MRAIPTEKHRAEIALPCHDPVEHVFRKWQKTIRFVETDLIAAH